MKRKRLIEVVIYTLGNQRVDAKKEAANTYKEVNLQLDHRIVEFDRAISYVYDEGVKEIILRAKESFMTDEANRATKDILDHVPWSERERITARILLMDKKELRSYTLEELISIVKDQ